DIEPDAAANHPATVSERATQTSRRRQPLRSGRPALGGPASAGIATRSPDLSATLARRRLAYPPRARPTPHRAPAAARELHPARLRFRLPPALGARRRAPA